MVSMNYFGNWLSKKLFICDSPSGTESFFPEDLCSKLSPHRGNLLRVYSSCRARSLIGGYCGDPTWACSMNRVLFYRSDLSFESDTKVFLEIWHTRASKWVYWRSYTPFYKIGFAMEVNFHSLEKIGLYYFQRTCYYSFYFNQKNIINIILKIV